MAFSFLLRHTLLAVGWASVAKILWIYSIDTPEIIYHCPLDRDGLHRYWIDENCYWSSSYAEAREKFISLGNRLRDQIRLANELSDEKDGTPHLLHVLDIESISYDIADPEVRTKFGGNYSKYAESIDTVPSWGHQIISPEKDTVDALLLTLPLPRSNDGTSKEHIDVIHSSGVHGAEGYLGSAVQLRYLHELFLNNERKLLLGTDIGNAAAEEFHPVGTRKVLLIHAVNPYGMRHHRRTNENNVDLNRNTLLPEEWKALRSQDPNFAGYVDMDHALNPFQPSFAAADNKEFFSWAETAKKAGFRGDMTLLQRRDEQAKRAVYRDSSIPKQYESISITETTTLLATITAWIDQTVDAYEVAKNILNSLVEKGYTNSKRAIVAAQYHKKSGTGYGGGAHKFHINAWENSVFAVQHAIDEFGGFHLTHLSSEAVDPDTKVYWIDVHTGLGPYGTFKMLGFDSSPTYPLWRSKIKKVLGKSQVDFGGGSDGVTSGYDKSKGFINGLTLCPPPHCYSESQEFGTRPGIAVAFSMVMENKGFNVGRRQYGKMTSWAFNPHRLSWRQLTLRGGINMLDSILNL